MSESHGNGGLIIAIVAPFTIVILALATIFATMISGLAKDAELRDDFQRERLAIYTTSFDAKVVEMDIKLQQEIQAEAALRDRRFSQAESDSTNRHNAQQAQINEMKSWFRPPALRDNGAFNDQ